MRISRNKSIIPPFLKKGDQIEIIAPSKFILKSDIITAIELIKLKGYKVKINSNIFKKSHVFAGNRKNRINSAQLAIDDPKTKALFFARGGYGAIQIIDDINFTQFLKAPKWLLGFSDITIILMHAYSRYGIVSIHGPMLFNFRKTYKKHINTLFNILKGGIADISLNSHKLNRPGLAEGVLIGGNLSVLCSLIGSKSFPNLNKKHILFIEEVDEYLYHLERMLYTLDRAGVLKRIEGLIVGQMTNMMDNQLRFGKTANQIIKDIIDKYNYPICFDFPIGHNKNNNPIIVGLKVEFVVDKKLTKIRYIQ